MIEHPSEKPLYIASDLARALGNLGGLLFTCLFFLVTLPIQMSTWPSLRAQIHTYGYAHASAKVQTSELVASRSSKGTLSYSAVLSYGYTVDGQSYSSGAIYAGGGGFGGSRSVELFVRRHEAGTPLSVYHHPKNPADAVIYRGMAPSSLLGALFAIAINAFFLLAWRGAFLNVRWPGQTEVRTGPDPLAQGLGALCLSSFLCGMATAAIAGIIGFELQGFGLIIAFWIAGRAFFRTMRGR